MKIINITKTIAVPCYEAIDGRTFESETECLQYERTINQRIEEAKAIPSLDCHIPFTSWDLDVEESKIYILHSKDDYDKLSDWYVSKWCCDLDYWDEPKSYPTAMLIISRETLSAGYILEMRHIQDMYNAAHQMVDAYFTVHKEEK